MNISEHDKKVLERLERLDESFLNWPQISSVADELEDRTLRDSWKSKCKTYNHLEEAWNDDL